MQGFEVRQRIDLARENKVLIRAQPIERGDVKALTWIVTAVRDGRPEDLTGASAALYCARTNAPTVRSDEGITIEGNVVTAALPQDAANVPGPVACLLEIATGSDGPAFALARMALVATDTTGEEIIDQGGRIPSYEQLMAEIDAMRAATSAANTAAGAANTAAGQATTAASTASTAAGQANTAAGNASTAAGAANTAAQTANTAAQKIDGMTVSATGLTAGSNPTVVISDVDGHKHVAFGIPAGQTGPQGDTGATPEITIGTVTTGEPGTEASATMTGTPEAPMLSLTIPRGMPGEGDVSSVAGVMPDEDGDVPLAAADVGAYAAENIRSLTFSIAASAWAGTGPYTYTLTDSGVTANTWCDFELTSAVQALLTADIAWTTSAGQIALSTQARPAGTLSGTILLTEVSA